MILPKGSIFIYDPLLDHLLDSIGVVKKSKNRSNALDTNSTL